MSDGFRIRNLDTWSATEQEQSKACCRHSELFLLPYFDGTVIDPMYYLFLGSAKHLLKEILMADSIIKRIPYRNVLIPLLSRLELVGFHWKYTLWLFTVYR